MLGHDLLVTQEKKLASSGFLLSGAVATQLRLAFLFLFCEFAPYNKENIIKIF